MYRSVKMMLTAAATALLILLTCHSVDAQSCSKYSALRRCSPESAPKIRHFVSQDAAVNVSLVFRFFTSGETNITRMCTQYNIVARCLKGEMHGCHEATDAYDNVVYFWDQASSAVDFMCNEKQLDFINAQLCLTPDVRTEAAACDMFIQQGHGHMRKRRHGCGDYEQAIYCADTLVTNQCGEYIARVIGRMTRVFLKSSPHTRDCWEPEFISSATRAVLSTSSLPILVTLLLLNRFQLQQLLGR